LKTSTRRYFIFALPLVIFWSAASLSFAQAPAQGRSLDDYRKYALTHEGNVARGARLFAEEQRLACSKCHSVDGSASKAGPDLFAAGDKFGRRDLVQC
jgi:mono/diheme cytochrome c family protein